MDKKNNNTQNNDTKKISNQKRNIVHTSIISKNTLASKNIQLKKTQTDEFPNYNYPPMINNPQMKQNNVSQNPQFNQDYYIDFQMPKMDDSNILCEQEKMPQQPLQKCPKNIEDLKINIDKCTLNNIQIIELTPKTQIGLQDQTGFFTADNLDHTFQNNINLNLNTTVSQFQPRYSKQTQDLESQQDEKKQKNKKDENQIQVVIVQDIPPNPIAESQYDNNNLRVSRIHGLKKNQKPKKKKFIKKDTISHSIVQSTDQHIYYFAQLPAYHSTPCCCSLTYADDCCVKQICDVLFQCLFLPLRIIAYVIKSIFSLCCKDQSESAYQCFRDCCYAPFLCIGNWANQCYFSWSNFCCQGLDFIPNQVQHIYKNCFQKCFLQIGQFFKNCCSFQMDCNCCKTGNPSYSICSRICENDSGEFCCNNCCQCIGDCCQNCCSPQGFFEDIFKCCKGCCCDFISQDCLSCFCGCCVEKQNVKVENEDGQIFTFCCCCICETVGAIIIALRKVL